MPLAFTGWEPLVRSQSAGANIQVIPAKAESKKPRTTMIALCGDDFLSGHSGSSRTLTGGISFAS